MGNSPFSTVYLQCLTNFHMKLDLYITLRRLAVRNSTSQRLAIHHCNFAAANSPPILSRCAVCISDSKLLAVHSFNAQKPTSQINNLRAHGWQELYEGYSFLFSGGVKEGAGHALQSHGSCMKHFTPVSVVQTNGQEVRWLSQNFATIWIVDYRQYLVSHSTDDPDVEWNVDNPDSRVNYRNNVLGKCAVMQRAVNERMRFEADPQA